MFLFILQWGLTKVNAKTLATTPLPIAYTEVFQCFGTWDNAEYAMGGSQPPFAIGVAFNGVTAINIGHSATDGVKGVRWLTLGLA